MSEACNSRGPSGGFVPYTPHEGCPGPTSQLVYLITRAGGAYRVLGLELPAEVSSVAMMGTSNCLGFDLDAEAVEPFQVFGRCPGWPVEEPHTFAESDFSEVNPDGGAYGRGKRV